MRTSLASGVGSGVLAEHRVVTGEGDLDALLGDADALDRHSRRELRDRDGEVRQVPQGGGRYPAGVNDLDVDLVPARLGDLGHGRVAERAEADGRLHLI